MAARPSIRDLETEYKNGNTKPLEDVIRAFKGIQELPVTDPNSFFTIAGYHVEPFRGAGWGNSSWWGGYCNHGNVLFPTWHRAYLYRLEKALQSIKGCESVMLPYWDETDDISFNTGLPPIFTSRFFTLDGVQIKNPLYSYAFQIGVYDNLTPDAADADYTKPPGYETVRYPYSGLVGVPDRDATKVHNARYNAMGDDAVNKILNNNISAWLGPDVQLDTGKIRATDTRALYAECLKAPNYTVFSNQTSTTQYNEDNFNLMPNDPDHPPPIGTVIVPLETPHNRMHLAVGGFELPTDMDHTADAEPGANGDMGENDTSSFDPLFFFHHCFVDRVFWQWQVNSNATQTFEIIDKYPGTNSIDAQGPIPGMPANVWLTMDTPLEPFLRDSDGKPMTSRDVINIESLGYTYILPSALIVGPAPPKPPTLRVAGANRAAIAGSFLISTWVSDPADASGKTMLLAEIDTVLSRWHVSGCANCLTHLGVKTFVPLHGMTHGQAAKAKFEVRVHTRGDRGGPTKVIVLPKPDLEVRKIAVWG